MEQMESLQNLKNLVVNKSKAGEIIKNMRIALGYKQKEFANILSVHLSSLSRWERNISEPMMTFQQAEKLENELKKINMSITDIPNLSVIVDAKELKALSFANHLLSS